ncbi:flavodoxin family protein [Sutcliffiella rhizosphaerae]|uniref:NAD(P)H-dependent FMN-containing oxidoreductase YwqN n=1 Tax=Sutcliffiella rhizosphaerae TaxID=2880967 RepID=A0ABM8YKA6_9BACI|nr:flavodoxin family protein [Sutcliffiella rhizosphaerae]CAG9620377.1 Putative NAD(P)H-dependent FMN-containing oxidoreductase YwqN [Sutcliffiella rhizosphaerae]
MSIAIIYGGTRKEGNTEILTKHAIQGIEVEEFYLRDYRILPIEDMRHDEDGFQDRGDDYASTIKRVLQHDTLIFVTPIYWYSMTGTMKNFVDRWSHSMRDAAFPDFKAQMGTKEAYVIAVGGDAPAIKGLPMVEQFKYIFEFMGVEFKGYIIGKGNKPGDILEDKVALFQAEQLRKKL